MLMRIICFLFLCGMLFGECGDPCREPALPNIDLIEFKRGDSNQDLIVNFTDITVIVGFLFNGNPAILTCPDAADANDDSFVTVADASVIANFLFLGGPPPPAPGPMNCGCDLTVDILGCVE